jgi:hypothetical protein
MSIREQKEIIRSDWEKSEDRKLLDEADILGLSRTALQMSCNWLLNQLAETRDQLAVSLEKNRELEKEIAWFKSHTVKVDEYNSAVQ